MRVIIQCICCCKPRYFEVEIDFFMQIHLKFNSTEDFETVKPSFYCIDIDRMKQKILNARSDRNQWGWNGPSVNMRSCSCCLLFFQWKTRNKLFRKRCSLSKNMLFLFHNQILLNLKSLFHDVIVVIFFWFKFSDCFFKEKR